MNFQISELLAPEKRISPSVKLESLTALRFFGAAMILVLHAAPFFHCMAKPYILALPLTQGVSFFFVLSGFILTFNYPNISGLKEIASFWRARFARIWPAHAFAILLGIFLFDLRLMPRAGVPIYQSIIAHLAMVHGWILKESFYATINPVSWTISTEFMFYLLFPLFIWRQEKNWWQKLIIAGLLVAAFIVYASSSFNHEFSVADLIITNPLARIFEFILGMSTATLWLRFRQQAVSPRVITALELGCVGLIAVYIANISTLIEPLQALHFGKPLQYWLRHNGNCFAFAALIYLCALQKGLLAKLLSKRVFVYLGEISYSIYLLHYLVLLFYYSHAKLFHAIPSTMAFVGYCAIVLGAAHLTFNCIEKPLRAYLIGRKTDPLLMNVEVRRKAGVRTLLASSLRWLWKQTGCSNLSQFIGNIRSATHSATRSAIRSTNFNELRVHMPFLDGLKGLSIFWLLSFYSGGPIGEMIAGRGGWIGAEAFLVISGFAITNALLKEQAASLVQCLKNFYADKVLRLLPAYSIFIMVTYFANSFGWRHQAPPTVSTTINNLSTSWGHSLGNESAFWFSLGMFCLSWPITARLGRNHLDRLACTTGALWLIGQSVIYYASGAASVANVSFLVALGANFGALLIGCLGSLLVNEPKIRLALQKYSNHFVLPIMVLTLVVFFERTIGEPFNVPSATTHLIDYSLQISAFATLFTLLIVLLHLRPHSVVARFLSSPPLAWLGKISYSVYLWHSVALSWVMQYAVEPGKSERVDIEIMIFVIAIIFASISYYLFERPFCNVRFFPNHKGRMRPEDSDFPQCSSERDAVSHGGVAAVSHGA